MQHLIVGAIIGNLIYMRSLQAALNTVQDQLLCPKQQAIKQNKLNLRYVHYIRKLELGYKQFLWIKMALKNVLRGFFRVQPQIKVINFHVK